MNTDVVSWGDCALSDMLRHDEEIKSGQESKSKLRLLEVIQI